MPSTRCSVSSGSMPRTPKLPAPPLARRAWRTSLRWSRARALEESVTGDALPVHAA